MAQATNAGQDVAAAALLAANATPINVTRHMRPALPIDILGYDGGSSPDTTPPTISAVSPTPSVAPGEAGGFPANFATAKLTPIVIDVTDTDPGVTFLAITDGDGRVAFRATNFQGDYILESSQADITAGVRLTILPVDGWPPADDPSEAGFVTLVIDAIDAAGNYSTSTLVWPMPVASRAVEPTTIVVTGEVGDDHVAEALRRLPSQFR